MLPVYVSRLFLCHLSVTMLLCTVNGKGQRDGCPESFDCGSLGTNIRFPLTKAESPECGALAIHGCDANQAQLIIGGKKFQVTRIEQHWHSGSNIVYIIDEDLRTLLVSGSCKVFDHNITLPQTSPLGFFTINNNITLFKCKRNLTTIPPNTFLNYTLCSYNIFFVPPGSDEASLAACPRVQLPAPNGFANSANPFALLNEEIPIQFNPSHECALCLQQNGDKWRSRPHCLLDSKGKFDCVKRKDRSTSARRLGVMLGLSVGPSIILGLILVIWHRKRKNSLAHIQLQPMVPSADSCHNPETQTERIFFGVPIFSYKELQEATNNFDHTRKLGEGGFGSVYYGKLVDGRDVAVKHLFDHNYRRVEQFMNEIEILTRLRHRNLVSLYGCTSRHSRELLLVYEYIPNGTVASHLHGELARAGLLSWPIRMQIAIETATALAYLHASDIIHRDVKTNNILLDINFSVKVADFGLSRLFPYNATHVSTAPQGSPGYLDPDYFLCYQLTAKSDVYSFGVVLMELITSMPAVDAARERDEINLANLATKKIQKGALSELVDPSLGFESENKVKRKVILVAELAFRCVQVDKELRPSMDEVLNALEKIESADFDAEHVEKGNDGAVISQSEELHQPSTTTSGSGDWSQGRFVMNKRLRSSPNSLTQKWESESTTTPNASA